MLNLCQDVQRNDKLKELCTEIFNGIVDWYKKTHHDYSPMLRREMSDNIEELEKECINTISSYTDEIVFTLSYQFSTKLSLFSVADALEKLILFRHSASFDTSFCSKYGINPAAFDSNLNKEWFNVKLNDVQMIEIVAKVLSDENEKPRFDLSALHEDRHVRSRGTHIAYFEKFLSVLRCYNTIREMIVFLDSDLETELPKFESPINDRFDVDDFISRSKISFEKCTTILVVESLHDVPAQYLEDVANLSWDIVVDFDGYTRKYGFASHIGHFNVQHYQLTDPASILPGDVINHSYTRWYQCGDYQIRTTNLVNRYDRTTGKQQNISIITGLTPYFRNRSGIEQWDSSIFDKIVQLAYRSERRLNIVVLSNNRNFIKHIANSCINYDPDLSFFCSWIGFGELTDEICFDQYDDTENKILMDEHIAHYNCSAAEFFETISSRKISLGWKPRYSEVKRFLLPTEKMPNGKEISENDRNYLDRYFDILYLGAEYDPSDIKKETDAFYCGGKASWSVIASGEAILLSDKVDAFIDDIKTGMGVSQTNLEKQIFFVKHIAGQGGTTLARQIAWKLHKQYPVLELKRTPGVDFQRVLQKFYDQVVDSTPFVILCDDADVYVNDLINYVQNIQRRFSLIVSVRENHSLLKLYQNAKCLAFATLSSDMIEALKVKFRSNSQLSEDILQAKDVKFNTELSEKNPFFIGLYYKEKDFDIEKYVSKTLENAPDDRYRKMLACIAMCDVMGQKNVPVLLIRKMIGVSQRTDALAQFPDAESLIGYSNDKDVPYYSFRHYLLADKYLKLYTDYVKKTSPDVYFDLAKNIIEYSAEACSINSSVHILDLLTYVIIQNRDDADDSSNIKMSKFLSSLGTPEQRIGILEQLGEAFEEKARTYIVSDDYKTDDSHKKTIQLVSHAYAHLGRIYSKAPMSNYTKAAEYLGYARSFMLGNDPDIYHMEGSALHEQLRYNLEYCRNNMQESNDDDNISLFKRIIELYNYVTTYGSPEYGIPSKMMLCKDILDYLCEKNNIKNKNDISRLNIREQEVYSCFMEALEEADAYGIEKNPIVKIKVDNCREWLNSGQIFGNTGEVVAYFQQQYEKCNKVDYYSTNRSLLYLTYAQINHFRAKFKTVAYHRRLYKDNRMKADELKKNIQSLLEAHYDKDSGTDYVRRTRLFSEWFQMAKASDHSVLDCIGQAQKWSAMEEEHSKNNNCKRNLEPWYYLMVFYYLEALEGGTESAEEARRYQKDMENDTKFDSRYSYAHNKFRDLLVNGKGAGQLLNVKHCKYEKDILREAAEAGVSPKIGKGIFDATASGAGEIRLFEPMQWNDVFVHVRFGREKNNTLNEKLKEHKMECPIGFVTERPHALSDYVKDISAGECLDMFYIMLELKNNVEKENKPVKQNYKKNNRRRKR